MLKIYTDGSCKKHSAGGYAAILVFDDGRKDIVIQKGVKNTTNNQMELTAVIEALKKVMEMFLDDTLCVEQITIYSDSAYVVNAVNQNWIKGWEKRGYKTIAGTPVLNVPLWKEFDALRNDCEFITTKLTFEKVKAHSGDKYNELADAIACQAADALL